MQQPTNEETSPTQTETDSVEEQIRVMQEAIAESKEHREAIMCWVRWAEKNRDEGKTMPGELMAAVIQARIHMMDRRIRSLLNSMERGAQQVQTEMNLKEKMEPPPQSKSGLVIARPNVKVKGPLT